MGRAARFPSPAARGAAPGLAAVRILSPAGSKFTGLTGRKEENKRMAPLPMDLIPTYRPTNTHSLLIFGCILLVIAGLIVAAVYGQRIRDGIRRRIHRKSGKP